METIARQEIINSGGSISHHHGVGKIRSKFMNQIISEEYKKWYKNIKNGIDPDNLFGVCNTWLYEDEDECKEVEKIKEDISNENILEKIDKNNIESIDERKSIILED